MGLPWRVDSIDQKHRQAMAILSMRGRHREWEFCWLGVDYCREKGLSVGICYLWVMLLCIIPSQTIPGGP